MYRFRNQENGRVPFKTPQYDALTFPRYDVAVLYVECNRFGVGGDNSVFDVSHRPVVSVGSLESDGTLNFNRNWPGNRAGQERLDKLRSYVEKRTLPVEQVRPELVLR
jgi:hypothetical protein